MRAANVEAVSSVVHVGCICALNRLSFNRIRRADYQLLKCVFFVVVMLQERAGDRQCLVLVVVML